MSAEREERPASFFQALLPILVLLALIVYGLVLRPLQFDREAFPLEIVFVLAAAFAIAQLLVMGHRWEAIQRSIVRKLARALPAFFILFSIGVLISSWIACGTIPMLVYYGIEIIDPRYLYVLAFLVPVIFSTLTGTSYGSAGTIGVVIMGVAGAVGADLAITAGAVIGGAYFGDKISPLSDTTNLAALAADVGLFDHIRSMMVTTLPSALLATVAYFALGFIYPPEQGAAQAGEVAPFLAGIEAIFRFHPLLLLPPAIVLFGSLRRLPTVPVLFASILVAAVLALLLQPFSLTDVMSALHQGFRTEMAPWAGAVPSSVVELVDRGGLYALNEAIVTAFMVFLYVGAVDHIDAMPIVVGRLFRFARNRASAILSALAATALTNSLTSNQYATTFIVGDAFKSKFDALGIPRRVLSRSLEDTGTMLESVVPWTVTALFMGATLGVECHEYWHWQLLSLFNFVVAPLVAILGIGCGGPPRRSGA